MDFSSHNPNTSNALSLAARRNNVQSVSRLINKINPNCIDNRGWTCLHEAANSDSYECLEIILNDPKCRALAETHEGHTALYLACRQRCSIKTVKLLLDVVKNIANYGSTENVTPLHVASGQGRVDLIQLLIDYGAMINVTDFDGDTPLHDAALSSEHDAVNVLLHAGADPEIKNDANLLTPFHLACSKGCYKTVQNILPFILDVNQLAAGDESPLMIAVRGGSESVVKFLLENGADPHIVNEYGLTALDIAINLGYASIFKILLSVTDKDSINPNIILDACKPHYFKFDILEALLNSDLGPEFFDFIEPFHVILEEIGGIRPVYLTNAPLNSYLNICEYIYSQSHEKFREFFFLFLMRGVGVNAININECPPLVYFQYCMNNSCFIEVLEILREHECNVDYCTTNVISTSTNTYVPDAVIAALSAGPETLCPMLRYSLLCEPNALLTFAFDNGLGNRMSVQVQQQLISMIDENIEGLIGDKFLFFVPSLRHWCRLKIRSIIRDKGSVKSTKQYQNTIKLLPIPPALMNYLQYL